MNDNFFFAKAYLVGYIYLLGLCNIQLKPDFFFDNFFNFVG